MLTEISHAQADSGQAKWRQHTEYIIAFAELAFAALIFVLYFGSSTGVNSFAVTKIFVAAFPLICMARLAYVHWGAPGAAFAWISASIDIGMLTSLIYIFSHQYGTASASLSAPSFSYYFVFIVLHGMRFRLGLALYCGAISSLAWAGLLANFVMAGAGRTHSYADYISSSNILVGAEIEKIVALIAFTAMMALGVKRADTVLKDAADKEVAEVKQREAEKTAQLKTEFLANMSHEIRTPMNGVLGMVQVLRSTDLDQDQLDFVETIERSGDALLTIINDILDFSKFEAGKLRLDKAPFNLRSACEDVMTLLGVTARDKGIELVLDLDADVPVNLVGDAGRLRQILTNLIGNAIKFTEKGHVMCQVKGAQVDGIVHLNVAVQDTGIGISDEQMKNIFSEFAQADNSTTRRYGGTGLGLTISKSLVSLMDGDLQVSSVRGEGSTFTFSVELMLDRRQTGAKERPSIVDIANLPILVVDDLKINSDILKLQLQKMGAAADIVSSAREAVEHIVRAHNAHRPYAIMVTDYQMPEVHGLELVTKIRQRAMYDPLEIIVLSSIDSASVKEGFLTAGVSAYMTKPCRINDLKDAIYTAAARYKTGELSRLAHKNCGGDMKPQETISEGQDNQGKARA